MTFRTPSLALLAAATFAGALGAQHAREIVAVDDPTARSTFGGLASDDDVTAMVYVDHSDNSVRLVLSDGRGTDWGAPLRADQSPNSLGKIVGPSSVAVAGNRVYVSWLAGYRNGSIRQQLFMNVYDPVSGSFTGEQFVELGFALQAGQVLAWDMAAAPNGNSTRLHFAASVSGNGMVTDMVVTSTDDFGANFAPTHNLTPGNSSVEFDRLSMAVDGLHVHVAWGELESYSSPGRRVRYVRSSDGGASFAPVVGLDASGPQAGALRSGIELVVAGNTVGVAWVELAGRLSGSDRLRVNVSTDRGVTFGGDRRVGQPGLAENWIHQPRLAADPDSGAVLVAWVDYRGSGPAAGSPVAIASTSRDGGRTWSADARLSPFGGVRLQALRPRRNVADGRSEFVVTWDAFSGPDDSVPFASFSDDSGVSWRPPVRLHTDPIGSRGVAYNTRYGNYVVGLAGDRLFAGGFRPQTLTPIGWTVGSAASGFHLSGFDGSPSGGAVLLSMRRGRLSLPDGRDLGLVADGLLIASLTVLPFFAPISTSGAGNTPLLPLALPAGLEFHAVGLSFGSTTIAQLTDTVRVRVQ